MNCMWLTISNELAMICWSLIQKFFPKTPPGQFFCADYDASTFIAQFHTCVFFGATFYYLPIKDKIVK